MIRLATAFSGIGAIEHALNRMGLENEIVFACDNGDVNILTKDVDTDIDEIETELESLSELIEEISINDNVEDLYKNQLEGMLRASMTEFHEVDEQLNNVEEKDNELLKNTTTELLDSNVLKANRKKEYSSGHHLMQFLFSDIPLFCRRLIIKHYFTRRIKKHIILL